MKSVHLVTHTHWDREWYRTYEEFRVFLVRLLDDLLRHLDENQDYASFLLDGQTVQLEDYLEVRPDMEDTVRRHIRSGRLIIGPMYIQPDEFVPSSESLVRNFLVGKHISDRFGEWMNIGYFPDSFGQASQIPQILRGFGMEDVVFWRGLCEKDSDKTEFLWRSREGSEVLAVWMPFSYGNAHTMASDPQQAAAFFEQGLEVLGSMATTDQLLFMKGWDHSSFSPWVPETIRAINPMLEGKCTVRHSSLPELVQAVRQELPRNLKVLEGEFRNAKTARIHPGIGTTRMDIKQKNRRAEKLLEKAVEPVSVMASTGSEPYPADMIRQAWKYALQSQAHDSLCCCCTDQALKAVADRYRRSDEIGSTLLTQAAHALASQVKTDGRQGQPLVLINPLPLERSDFIRAEVLTQMEEFRLINSRGEEIPYQILEKESVRMGFDPSVAAMSGQKTEGELLEAVGQRPDNPEIYYDQSGYVPISDEASGIRMNRLTLGLSGQFEGAGWDTCFLQEGAPTAGPEQMVSLKGSVLENAYLRVELQPNGSFHLTEKQGQEFRDLHVFADGGDAGDSYNYSPPFEDSIVSSKEMEAQVEVLAEGPLWAGWRVSLQMDVPSGLSKDGRSRAGERKPVIIISEISLSADARAVSIRTEVENEAEDHRLRVLFPTDIESDVSFAEEQFGVITRLNRRPEMDIWEEEGWVEAPLPIYQQQNFVDVNDGERGLALLNRDLTEYEILQDGRNSTALTLFRSVGAMGRPDLVIRPGRASGLTVPTPDSNLKTRLVFHYAVYPHTGDYSSVGVESARYTTPCHVVQTNRHGGEQSAASDVAGLKGYGLVPTCLKRAEWRDGIVLRFYNATPEPIQGAFLKENLPAENVFLVDLKEDNLSDRALEKQEQGWAIPEVRSSQFVTLLIEEQK